MKRQVNIFIIMLLIGILALMANGCSSSDDTATPCCPTDNENEQESFEGALKYATASVSKNSSSADSIHSMHNATFYMDLEQSQREKVNFQCGTVSADADGLVYTFNGNDTCGGVTGTIAMNIERNGQNIVWNLEYIDFVAGDCLIDGMMVMDMEYNEPVMTTVYSYEDMSICGEAVTGTTTFTHNWDTGEYSFNLPEKDYSYSGTIRVDTDLDYDDEGVVSGIALVNLNNTIYDVSVTGVAIDESCGLPTSGTLTITSRDGNSIVVDFTGSSCENPYATYTWNGETYTYDLDTVIELLNTV